MARRVGLLGVIGFAVTFALQQPILSFIGWFYILVSRPYAVGDRVNIGSVPGDVAEIDFLVTTLWETGGPLASNQPTGRTVTVPNSLVLSSEVVNYGALFDRVWTEIPVQVSYETDLPFVRRLLLDVADGPTVNVAQVESWVVFRLRVLVPPTRAQRVKNRLYERILDRLADHPDRVSFPVSRNR